jgi:hypothetical protein
MNNNRDTLFHERPIYQYSLVFLGIERTVFANSPKHAVLMSSFDKDVQDGEHCVSVSRYGEMTFNFLVVVESNKIKEIKLKI